MTRVLYISYDGMLEPLGQSQVLGYLEELAGSHEIGLISFEKPEYSRDQAAVDGMKVRMRELGIRWRPLRYHRTPSVPATFLDIGTGSVVAVWMTLRHRYRIVHARSYVAALMGLFAKRLAGARLLFDMRGFWADERVDGNLWSREGRVYKAAKSIERRLLRAADHIVTLTHASIPAFRDLSDVPVDPKRVTVIPTCANLDMFERPAQQQIEPFVLGYVGSIGTWYLFDDFLRLFKALQNQRPDARLLVVNRDDHDLIHAKLDQQGIDRDVLELTGAAHRDVPALVGRMTAATALIRPCFSKLSSAPTKLAEYLGCGVPCVGNSGVGDVNSILSQHKVGVVLDTFDEDALDAAVTEMLQMIEDPELPARCRQTALDLFSRDQGVEDYDRIYRSM